MSDAERPNIVFLTVDSLRADAVGWHGEHTSLTPNLDGLAAGGTTYENAFINGIGTPVSFPAIFTGTYPLSHGGPKYLSENRPSVPAVLSEAGYRTVGLSTNHYLSLQSNYHRGFDEFNEFFDLTQQHLGPLVRSAVRLYEQGYSIEEIRDEMREEFLDHYEQAIRGCEEYLDAVDWGSSEVKAEYEQLEDERELLLEDFEEFLVERCGMPRTRLHGLFRRLSNELKSVAGNSDLVSKAYHSLQDNRNKPYMSATRLSDELVTRMENDGEPYFVWGHYMDVHTPFLPGDNDTWPGEFERYVNAISDESVSLEEANRQLEDAQELLYRACVRYVDNEIGRVLDAAQKSDRETIVVVTSDHGEEFGEHGSIGHDAKLYEELIHVPLVVGNPANDNDGRVVQELVSLVDLLPTVFGPIAEIDEIPEGMDGQNVLESPRNHVIAETLHDDRFKDAPHQGGRDVNRDNKRVAVRTDNEKLIYYEDRDDWEYFDLEADPGEQVNRSESEPFDDLKAVVVDRIDTIESQLDQTEDVERPDVIQDRLEDLGYR